ncbi:MAG: phage portal protein [Phycisphaerales bacterium]|nr:phage portal protein [Phycisphaerales bacterium]
MGIFNWFGSSEKQGTINGIRYVVSNSSEGEKIKVDLLSIPAISSAIEIKSNDVSQIPMSLYRRTTGGRQKLRNQLHYRLNQQPNRYQSAASFWKTVAMQSTMGECFVSTRGGELTILPYGSTVRYTTPIGEVRYATTYTQEELKQLGQKPDSIVIKDDYAYNEVLHFWTFQDEYGKPITLRNRFKHVLGLGSDLYAYTSNVYNMGGRVVGYLSTDVKFTSEDDKKDIVQGFKKLFKASRTDGDGGNLMAALDNGWKFNRLDLTPQEVQLFATKKDLQRDFAQIVNIPLWKLGVTEDYHYSTSEAAQREYLASCLNPLLNQIENEVNNKLIEPYERDYLYAEFDRDALIALDAKTMAEIDDLAIKNGTMSIDEHRERRNLPHSGHNIQQIPVNMNSASFMHESEALKLEKMRLENAVIAAQLAAAAKPLPPLTMQAEPPVEPKQQPEPKVESQELPAGAVADPAEAASVATAEAGGPSTNTSTTTYESAIATATVETAPSTQTAKVADAKAHATAEQLAAIQQKYLATYDAKLADAATMQAMCDAIFQDVADLYGLGDYLDDFTDSYVATALIRTNNKPITAYEVNRAINAANYEAITAVYGVFVGVKWVGGPFDGQIRTIGEPWTGNLKHPPIDATETDCYIVAEG